jgi:hypothetical protein
LRAVSSARVSCAAKDLQWTGRKLKGGKSFRDFGNSFPFGFRGTLPCRLNRHSPDIL